MCDSLFFFSFSFLPALPLDFCLCHSYLLWFQHSPGIEEMEAIAVEEILIPPLQIKLSTTCLFYCNVILKRLFA